MYKNTPPKESSKVLGLLFTSLGQERVTLEYQASFDVVYPQREEGSSGDIIPGSAPTAHGSSRWSLPAFTRNRSKSAGSTPAMTPDVNQLEIFLIARMNSNRMRIHQALFDQIIDEESPEAKGSIGLFKLWLTEKLKDRCDKMLQAIFCPLSQGIPESPVVVAVNYKPMMCDYLYADDKLKKTPAHETQSLIERLINLLYQFREQHEIEQAKDNMAKIHAHVQALNRYKLFRDSQYTNAGRFERILEGKGSVTEFIRYLRSIPAVANQLIPNRHYSRLEQLGEIPRMPVLIRGHRESQGDFYTLHLKEYTAKNIQIDYDFQNTIEQLINLAHMFKVEFTSRLAQQGYFENHI